MPSLRRNRAAASAGRWLRERLGSRSNVFLGIEIDCNWRNEAFACRRSSFCRRDEFVWFGSEVAAPKSPACTKFDNLVFLPKTLGQV